MDRSYRLLTFLINTIVTVVEIFLGLRFLLKLLGANPATPFVDWIYDTSQPLLTPFAGIFPSPVIDGQFVLEFSSLFAIIIYWLVAFLVLEFLAFVYRFGQRNRTTVVERTEVHKDDTR
jgi:hypothetical protein